MPSIVKVLEDIAAGTLTVSDCVDILHASEGVAASTVWSAPGHPLQHSAQVPGATGFRRIDDPYHFRGPLPVEKQLQGGPNAGKFKGAFRVEDGTLTVMGNTFHSQFEDDNQAGTSLKLTLESGGGRWALGILKNHTRVSVTVRFGMPGGTRYLHRASQLVGVGTPSRPEDRYIDQSTMESTYNFVLIDRRDMGSVVATLRSKDDPAGHLHVQTLYPTGDSLHPGTSVAEVQARDPADYSGPATMTFLL